ncbi:response regulator transcription factor [Chitinophaga sp. HK235]|uniref:response regulator transcription factor n=1 Tax=Chitinophaga sp. HK235 TaxID=2952571 RepID=UPI001BA67475|nr:response regulator [Chitinophaga sp. HK235]
MITRQRKTYKIFWVDDDPFFLNWIIPQVTIRTCFTVHTCMNARTALYTMGTASPDIILTNLVMPGMCGLEMIAAIRHQNPSIPIVVVSNRFNDCDRLAAFEAGADCFLSKAGVNGEVIIAGIVPYLNRKD